MNAPRYFDCHKMTDEQKVFVAKHGIRFHVDFTNVKGFDGPCGTCGEVEPSVFLCSRRTGWDTQRGTPTYHQVYVHSVREAMAFVIGRDNGPKAVKS